MICARPGCGRMLPKIAIDHGDGFCTSDCAKVAHGLMTAAQLQASRKHRVNAQAAMNADSDVSWRAQGEKTYKRRQQDERRKG